MTLVCHGSISLTMSLSFVERVMLSQAKHLPSDNPQLAAGYLIRELEKSGSLGETVEDS